MQVDLIWLRDDSQFPDWPLGKVWLTEPTPQAVSWQAEVASRDSSADVLCFWDARLGTPNPERVAAVIERPGDVWHTGLRLGMGGKPLLLEHVAPSWMLIVDPDPEREATSWRISLRACLVKREVLQVLKGPLPTFCTLAGASLEMGYRYLMAGAITRYIPWLVAETESTEAHIPIEDELRFIRHCFKPFWLRWSLLSALLSGQTSPDCAWRAWKEVTREAVEPSNKIWVRPAQTGGRGDSCPSVSVILPTLRRYQYLGHCLESLGNQSVRPVQILCVDQTPSTERRSDFYDRFESLPLEIIFLEETGQSQARNAALQRAEGEWLFFADDDAEYPPETIERHLSLIRDTGADGSTGLALPPYEYTVPAEYRYPRVAYNLATGNALIRAEAVFAVGGFDRHFDFGTGADMDLGMRLYLAGYLIMHNPYASCLHYKAGQGGLRTHGLWWGSSHIPFSQPRPVVSYTYWLMRYFKHWRKALLHSILFGNLPRFPTRSATRGELLRHYAVELLCLPLTAYQVSRSVGGARGMLVQGPRLYADRGGA